MERCDCEWFGFGPIFNGGTLPRHFAHFAALAIGFNESHGRLQVQPLCAAPLLRFWQFAPHIAKGLHFLPRRAGVCG